MKTAIVYHSHHHGNTKKLVDAIAEQAAIDVFEAENCPVDTLANYDLIGLASGIYYFSFHPSLLSIAAQLPPGKRVFLLSTYGGNTMGLNYARKIERILASRQADIIGKFGCLGYNTYGFFKLFGGTAKGHPSELDIQQALDFCRTQCALPPKPSQVR